MGEKWSQLSAAQFDMAYPSYLVNTHARWVEGVVPVPDGSTKDYYAEGGSPDTPTYSIVELINAAITTNPYSSAAAFDPDDKLYDVEEALEDYVDAVNSFNWRDLVDSLGVEAKAVLDNYYPGNDVDIAALVADNAAATELEYLRHRSAYAVRYYDINASSAASCLIGLALMDGERDRDLRNLAAKLQLQVLMQRGQAFLDAIRVAAVESQTKLEHTRAAVGLIAEMGKVHIIAKNDQYARDLEIDVRDLQWPVDLTFKGMQSLPALAGVPLAQEKPSKMEQALSSMLGTGTNVAMGVGQATGSPAAGLAAFGVNAAASVASMLFL